MGIELTFHSFHLENSSNCTEDYLEVQYHLNSSLLFLRKYCGDKLPPPLHVYDGSIQIKFKSNEVNVFGGFHVKFDHPGSVELHVVVDTVL